MLCFARSAIKKIFERDDAPGKRLVLCIASIIKASAGPVTGKAETATNTLDAKVSNQIPLKLVLGGVCSLANYFAAYEEA